ncbi:GtrA family protein [Latilactobacillus fragifolii]|uniref:GtrA family protein n=1 Tax=Latilactobacillus fragifolii TaxID=2814244 RepID=UPI001ABB99E4|nr:GtrA family protein [Latilactobacillus fragifolii]
MAFIKRLLFKYRDFLTYTVFGCLASLVNIFTYWVFRHTIIWQYLLANTMAWLVANLFGFFTNKSLVFQSKYTTLGAVCREVLSFFFFRSVSFFLDNGLMIVAISFLGWQSMPAKIIDQLIVGIVNYITTRYTFKKTEQQMALRGRILRRYNAILKRGHND